MDRLNEGESTRHSKSKNSSSTNPPKSKESLWDEQLQRGGIVSQDLLGKAEENEPERKRRRVQDNFQTETGTVDVDKYMLAYIEEELAKRRPTPSNPADQPRRTTEEQVKQAILDPNDELSQIAAQYRALQQRNRPPKKEEDDEGSVGLSAQMLASVPEVDLGIEAKLRNIEQTGIARRKLLAQKQQPTAKEELEANTRCTFSPFLYTLSCRPQFQQATAVLQYERNLCSRWICGTDLWNAPVANRSGVATESEFRAQIAENPNEIEDNFRFNTSFAKLADRQDKRATASDAYVADKFRQRQREHRKK